MVEKLNMKNKEKALEKTHDVVGQLFVVKSNRCFLTQVKHIFTVQKISSKIEESEARWPTRVYFGEEGQMKFSYTRRSEPNFTIKSTRYRCKSYRSYKCTARLAIKEIEGRDEYFLSGCRSENCTQ